ncbi:MFS transporter [Marinicauda algicola]|uniref:MFS transporter n=1 Tax=Marinicauda algicola TaxID=2029849 RepID=A0A4V3RXT4_9PROT|nr:MFS transporter [Marinicauda algicola]TGY87809.1 MFS transporter [Marinicauda algicola]
MVATTPAEEAEENRTLSAPHRRYALSVLLVIYIFNFLDRQVVNIVAEPIKIDLGLSDSQLGMLTGLAFALFYTVMGLPIARLAERQNRVKIISAAVAVWSAFTVACGLAANFIQLLLARVGVGVGEAGCTPPAHSLISDYVPREKRAGALAFYSLGIPLGSLAGMALGGLVADAWGWRAAFFIAGAPGVILAILAWLTLPEVRKPAERGAVHTGPSLGDAVAELRSKSAFWWIAVGTSIKAMIAYGHIAFYGSFYLRNHGEGLAGISSALTEATGIALGPIGFIGLVLGLLIGVFGAIGAFLGGMLSDRYAMRDARAYVFIPALAAGLSLPPFIWAMLTGSTVLSLTLLAIPVLLSSVWYGPVYAAVQSLVQPRTRATASAVLLFVVNLVGLGIGPLFVGIVSDSFAAAMGPAEGLRWSLIVISLAGVIGLATFLMASRRLREQIVS